MRFVWAVVAFVLATLMIGAGIAQRTVMQGPTSQTQAISVEDSAPYVLVDGAVLSSQAGAQTFRATADGTIFAAYGRTDDLKAWLARTDYAEVSMDGTEVTTAHVNADEPVIGEDGAPVPLSPLESDLWLDQFQQDDVLIASVSLPADMSLLVATDGVEDAPQTMSVTWPITQTTPWAGPLILGGAILMAVGLVLYVLAVRHVRRSRGPRRRGLPMPVTEPIAVAGGDGADKGVISASPSRRQLTPRNRKMVILPVVAVVGLLASGCSADAWPQLPAAESPSPTATVVVPEGQDAPPAVTEQQAARIIGKIAEQVASADEANDADLAATRLDGPELAARTTNYTLRSQIPEYAAPTAIPDSDIKLLLPEAYAGWPRSFFAVVADATTGTDKVMAVTQADPWSNYKLSSIADLVTEAARNVAPAYIGAQQVQPDSPFLMIAPQELAAAYADVIDNGDASQYAGLFADDSFRAQVIANRDSQKQTFDQTGASTGTISFDASAGTQPPLSLATLDSGAIVAVTVNETETVAPTTTDAVIKVDDNAVVKTLTGQTQSASGFTTTYSDQLFFFVPAQSSSERIEFLGYSSNILEAKVKQ
ncbi:glycosyl transferase [Microbacterium sp. W1N]|uniref:glycosyl transferase n=1 Tax=Microbacterium festucae TaxID=2977531 RepID=UPI0021C228FF|nr:glycosyl transferase [Microbacterium festucae]MCT9820292.1 glycosyl transferase [Microbacterium festucae]